MEKEIVFVLLDEFADWEAAFLAPALCSGVMPGRPGSYAAKYMSPDGESVRSIGGLRATPDYDASTLPESCAGLILVGGMQWEPAAARPPSQSQQEMQWNESKEEEKENSFAATVSTDHSL